MKAYYKRWLLDFLEACGAALFIPTLCALLYFGHWALAAAVIVAGLVWLTKPESREN